MTGVQTCALPIYAHTTSIEIMDIHNPRRTLYAINNTPIDFMPNLHVILLGVNNFLSNFVLTIDYLQKRFSISYP